MIYIDDTPDYAQNTKNYPKNPPCNTISLMNEKLSGKFLVFEGIDGSGKSTQCKRLMEFLQHRSVCVKKFSFKQSVIVHHAILKGKWENFDPYTHILLYLSSITDTLMHSILPALKEGNVVIMDRYIYSLIVRGSIRGISESFLQIMNQLRVPDMVLYFHVNEKVALERKITKGNSGISYWEAGGDLQYSDDLQENWLIYQKNQTEVYKKMFSKQYTAEHIMGETDSNSVFKQVFKVVSPILNL